MFVVVLISDPQERAVDDAVLRAAERAMMEAGALVLQPPYWLADRVAVEFGFVGIDCAKAEAAARQAVAGRPVDVAALAIAGRRKRLLIADMDSTIITCECIDELADKVGVKPQVAAITERAMRGEIDFPAALRERAALLAGLDDTALQQVFDERVRLTPGARILVQTMRAQGAHTALVSGGFTFFTLRVAQAAGFEWHQANRLEVAGGKLTGRVAEPILDAAAKLEALQRLVGHRHLQLAECLAVGDGANDRPMVEAAGLGVAFHAKPVLRQAARARIDHGDLTALLYLQGIPDKYFIGK